MTPREVTPEYAARLCAELTALERRTLVLVLIAVNGLLYEEVAAELCIGKRMVHKYAGAIRRALKAKTMPQAAFIAAKGGLL